MGKRFLARLGALAVLVCATPAMAVFHFWQIDQIYSDSTGMIQYIRMHEWAGADFEQFVGGQMFTTSQKVYTFPNNLPSAQTANRYFLMATAGFAQQPGAVTPDFIIPDNFFRTSGDTLNFASGTDTFTFSAAELPTDGFGALARSRDQVANTPINFAGQSGQIPLPGDANRDGRVDGEDFLIWQASFGIQSSAAWDDGDFNADGRVDGEDFLIWQANFGRDAGAAAAVAPEPGALAALLAIGALMLRRPR